MWAGGNYDYCLLDNVWKIHREVIISKNSLKKCCSTEKMLKKVTFSKISEMMFSAILGSSPGFPGTIPELFDAPAALTSRFAFACGSACKCAFFESDFSFVRNSSRHLYLFFPLLHAICDLNWPGCYFCLLCFACLVVSILQSFRCHLLGSVAYLPLRLLICEFVCLLVCWSSTNLPTWNQVDG